MKILLIILILVSLLLISCNNPTSTGGTVWVNPSGTRFHKHSCQYVDEQSTSMTRQQAIDAGYTACLVCKP